MADRIYGLNDSPPPGVLVPAALQHIGLGAVTLVFPLLVAEAAGADARTTAQYLSLAMLALGIATLLQAFGRFGIGSGFLLPAVFTAIHLPVALVAAQVGGLGAVAGLMLVAGLVEMALSRVVHRLRPFLPAEIVGLVVLVLGILLGLLSLRLMLGVAPGGGVDAAVLPGSLAALAVIVGLAVWTPPRVRVVAVLGGIAAGSAASALASLAGGAPSALDGLVLAAPAWPLSVPSLSLVLLPGALIGALACFVRAIGDIVASQRATDPRWKRPDYATIRAGTLADGMGTFAAGILGVIGVNSYSASVGLAIATGVLARRVAFAVGIGWILLGLVPGGSALMLAIPRGVLGAALLYASVFILLAGMRILNERLLDAKRAITVGIAFLLGLSFDAVPELYRGLPAYAQMLLGSSLVLAMLAGLLLNALFRIGAARRIGAAWRPAEGAAALRGFLEDGGRLAGARADAVGRAAMVLGEFAEAAPSLLAEGGEVTVEAKFDEMSIEVEAVWPGHPLAARAMALSLDTDPDDPALAAGLALRLMRHHADSVTTATLPDGRHRMRAVIDDR